MNRCCDEQFNSGSSAGETKYVAHCMDLSVVTQGDTLDETVANIREAMELRLDGEDLPAMGLCENPVIVAMIEIA